MEKKITSKELSMKMIERVGEEFGLKGSRVDGVNEPKTKPWILPPEMLKPNGPSPLDYEIVPENKKKS